MGTDSTCIEHQALVVTVPARLGLPSFNLYYDVPDCSASNTIFPRTQAKEQAEGRGWKPVNFVRFDGPLLILDKPLHDLTIVLDQAFSQVIDPDMVNQALADTSRYDEIADTLDRVLRVAICTMYCSFEITTGAIKLAADTWWQNHSRQLSTPLEQS